MEKAKNKKPYTIHQTDVIIDRQLLTNILESRDMEFKDLHGKIVEEYGLDLSYKGFMSLIGNRSSWKLIYAWAMSDILNTDIKTLFTKQNIDVGEKIKEKEEWKKKYQR